MGFEKYAELLTILKGFENLLKLRKSKYSKIFKTGARSAPRKNGGWVRRFRGNPVQWKGPVVVLILGRGIRPTSFLELNPPPKGVAERESTALSVPREGQKPVSVVYRDVGFCSSRGTKTGFPRKRGHAIWIVNNNAICDSRLPPRRPKVQKDIFL